MYADDTRYAREIFKNYSYYKKTKIHLSEQNIILSELRTQNII